jgi:large subunit ribosomal protein L27e
LTDMHDIKDVVKTDILTGENPDEKKEAAKAVRKAFMARFQEGKNKWFFSKLRF